ncbi:MAG: DUF1552 domain-containing protein, partial [Myxococcota bacterium]
PSTQTLLAMGARARLRLKKSVLDAVLPDIAQLEQKLGTSDKSTLESYFTNIRTLEQRLQSEIDSSERPTQISVPPVETLVQNKGAGHNSNGWYVDDSYNGRGHNHIDYHWRDTARLLSVAFQNDTVRSVAYMLETEAGENHYTDGPNGEQGLGDNHAASHRNDAAYGRRDRRHAQAYAEMIQAFKDTQVGNQRLIDNTLVVWGAGIGVTHSSDRVMAVVSGLTDSKHGIRHNTLRDMKNQSQKPFFQTLLKKLEVIPQDGTFGQGNQANDDIDFES